MDWLFYYFIFALSGALLTWGQIFRPSINLLGTANPDHIVYQSTYVSTLIWLCTAMVLIPILIVPLLHEESRQRFIYNLTRGFLARES
jgi:hypothetical protein